MLNDALGRNAPDLSVLKRELNSLLMTCEQALELYGQSLELNRRAQNINTTSLAYDRSWGADYAMDIARDQDTQTALFPAEQASQMLSEAFERIHMTQLPKRYPVEMSRIGKVPIAHLKVGNFNSDYAMSFLGGFGESINEIKMAKKISHNESELSRCINIVREQMNLIRQLEVQIDQDIIRRPVQNAPVIVSSMSLPPPPPPPPVMAPGATQSVRYLRVTSAHIVDEYDPVYQQHRIISIPAGETVTLVRGSLESGLGSPYNDYVEVNYKGRVGKVARSYVQFV